MTKEEAEKRLEEEKERFEYNLKEFRNKKIAEAPCFRSTFLTSEYHIEYCLKNDFKIKVYFYFK